jgi:hypothetical protein
MTPFLVAWATILLQAMLETTPLAVMRGMMSLSVALTRVNGIQAPSF